MSDKLKIMQEPISSHSAIALLIEADREEQLASCGDVSSMNLHIALIPVRRSAPEVYKQPAGSVTVNNDRTQARELGYRIFSNGSVEYFEQKIAPDGRAEFQELRKAPNNRYFGLRKICELPNFPFLNERAFR